MSKKQTTVYELPGVPKPKRASKSPPARMSRKAKKLSQYYTQPLEAARIAKFALDCVPDACTVLEPSAGKGSLIAALLELCGALEITAIDMDGVNAADLLVRFPQVLVAHADFLQWRCSRMFDLCVMNPPFENGAVAAHVARALMLARHVVCHCPLTSLAGQERRHLLWSVCELRTIAVCSTRPKYLDEGGKTDMCTVHVTMPSEPTTFDPNLRRSVDMEFWP